MDLLEFLTCAFEQGVPKKTLSKKHILDVVGFHDVRMSDADWGVAIAGLITKKHRQLRQEAAA